MTPEELKKVWAEFAHGNEFQLNPDSSHVEFIIKGILSNEQKFGLKLCPCRLRDGGHERDLELLCPCNFKSHDTWQKPMAGRGAMCWCGLFVRGS